MRYQNMENELLENLGRLHTTELGVIRIKKNLSLNVENVIEWCKEKISLSNAEIIRKGKNWYITIDNCIITINAYSYTYHFSQSKMINYSIKELNAFSVIGQEVELTNYQKKNIQISTQFWRKFNSSLKKKSVSFTIRKLGKICFYGKKKWKTLLFLFYSPKEPLPQRAFCIKKYRLINIWLWSISVLWKKYMKLMEKFIRKLFLIHHIPL